MLHVVRALSGLCCESDHAVMSTPPYAVLAIDGPEDAYIAVCRVHATELITQLQAALQALDTDDEGP
jgi:hypothetical protein